jgi:methionyl-tRNA formyltransferase
MRAVFFGTPDIAAVVLRALVDVAEVSAVVCQPDRPAGRGLKLKPPATKVLAMELGIEVVQPKKVRRAEFAQWLCDERADVAVVIAYGRILPKAVLDAPRRGCMNLHASILPKYRGAAPINWAIVHGESKTGVGLMQMDEGMDTGPVLCTRTIDIGENETAGELYVRLGELGANIVRRDLARAVDGELEAVAQHHEQATMAPMLQKADGRVDWEAPATKVHNLVRGMTPWPGAHTTLDGKRFKVLQTRLSEAETTAVPGTIVALGKDAFTVACGQGAVNVLRGQLEGRKALDAAQLAAGRAIATGSTFV